MEEEELLHSLSNLFSGSSVPSSATLDAHLQSLSDVARSSVGRQRLAAANAIPLLLSLSPHILHNSLSSPTRSCDSLDDLGTFTLYAKLLRNLCAGNLQNQEALVESNAIDVFAPIARTLAQGCCAPDDDYDMEKVLAGVTLDSKPGSNASIVELESRGIPLRNTAVQSGRIGALQMLLQLLGNVAGLGESGQVKIWLGFFPSIVESVAKVSSEKVQGPLCMLIYTCCRESKSRCEELSQGRGAAVVASLLNGGTAAATNEWLELLVSRLCMTESFFPILFCELGNLSMGTTETNGVSQTAAHVDVRSRLATTTLTKEQASLLDILNASLSAQEEEKHHEHPSSEATVPPNPMPLHSTAFLVDIIRCAAKCAASTSLSAPTLPTNSPVADVLGLSLSMTRSLCALDERRSTVVSTLASSGLIPLMLDLLRALGLPDNAKPRTPSNQDSRHSSNSRHTQSNEPGTAESVKNAGPSPEEHTSTGGEPGERPTALSPQFEAFPRKCVYIGYRRDIVAVIANASYRSFQIQEEVREKGGLLLVLQQCMPDTENPFLREWGLWAIRNLLEGNSKNQSELADLEVRSAVDDPRLKELGISVEVNPATGRPRLSTSSNAGSANINEFM